MKIVLILLAVLFLSLTVAAPCFAVIPYTSLIDAGDFVGIQTDVLATATGIITVLLVIVGLGILIKVLGR